MRVALSIIAMTVFGVAAQATPFVPSSSIPDATKMIPIKMSNMTCKEMMRMHQKMMAGKTMTCKEMMRMHRKMMGGSEKHLASKA